MLLTFAIEALCHKQIRKYTHRYFCAKLRSSAYIENFFPTFLSLHKTTLKKKLHKQKSIFRLIISVRGTCIYLFDYLFCTLLQKERIFTLNQNIQHSYILFLLQKSVIEIDFPFSITVFSKIKFRLASNPYILSDVPDFDTLSIAYK